MKKLYVLLTLLMVTTIPLPDAHAGEVTRAQFTSAIEAREPVDNLTIVDSHINNIYFFSELRNLQGETITHRWMFSGKVMAEISFEVGGPRWRVNSSKRLLPSWLGEWTVIVVDGSGTALAEYSFQYIEAGL